ncbi:hypothetical protein C440_00380 [Haloferax mucosum ATCC BAA-1512]|uniref:Uncharacterized protein n=2 Tax=Haloferax mucosum TaxID=403181 RepID=M0IPL0_9EURY|nr:hypothetical protein C440_00380 [Haloferax mucosum ATCC BAA-1512]
MREEHYQLVLDRKIDHPGKLSFERQCVVFCDETCAETWESRV